MGLLRKKRTDKIEDIAHYNLLKSMSEVYYSIHLINLPEDTVYTYAARNEIKELLRDNTHATISMHQIVKATVSEEHLGRILRFTDLATIEDRLYGKKMISADFIGKREGWVRATFITIDKDENDMPVNVVFTTQVIEEEKNREERIILKSNTDDMTSCYNRRAYEQELDSYRGKTLNTNLTCVIIDINGLKHINDTYGHAAGDEAIIGVANSLKKTFWNYGRVFRIGGDEFIAIVTADEKEFNRVMVDFSTSLHNYRGKYVNGLSASIGYAKAKDFPEVSYYELEKIAEEKMYQEKDSYYARFGMDRRGQIDAHKVLCNLYSKILSINLNDDSYQIINMDEEEKDKTKGFADKLSEWLVSFAMSKQVYEEDIDEYLSKTNLDYIKDYFRQDKSSLHIFYRRKIGDKYKQVMMEIVPAGDYTHDNQHMFLYVKSIDK